MPKGKILFVIDNLSTGGAQRQMISLATGLANMNFSVEVFCYAPGDLLATPLYKNNIPVHWSIKAGRFSPDVIKNLNHIITHGNYDIIISFLTTPNFYAIISTRLSSRRNTPVIISERFCDLPERMTFLERFSRWFYRYATHLVVNSHHQRENFQKKYPFLKSKITTIYNGYDLQTFSPPQKYVHNNPPKLLTIASVSPYKNGQILVESLNILHKHYGLPLTVDWIGQQKISNNYYTYFEKMNASIIEYGLDTHWIWLGQRTDIVDQLHNHDLLVHPSYGEGLPNVVCEAMACARPVIVSNTLDHPRLVKSGSNGYLFDRKNPEDLAEKIYTFSNLSTIDKELMSKHGREIAEKTLSMDRFLSDYIELFAQISKN